MTEIYNFLFVRGGPVMYFIVLGSVLALALFLERLWALRRERVTPSAFRRRVRTLIRKGQLSEAEVLCQENTSALATIIASTLRERGAPRESLKQTVNEVGRREVALMDRYVDLLGTIASVEPLMGLLGTVIGLIAAFQRVEALAGSGQGVNPGELAAGIWVAMITTAAGLVVAIPAYVGYRYLQARVNTLVVDLEEDSMEFAHLLAAERDHQVDSKNSPVPDSPKGEASKAGGGNDSSSGDSADKGAGASGARAASGSAADSDSDDGGQ